METERLDNLTKEIDDLKQGRIKVLEDTVDDLKKINLEEIEQKIKENINLILAQKIDEQKKELNSDLLWENIEKIIFDDNKLEQMKENAKKLAMPNAVNDFVSIFYDKFKGR